VGSAFAQDIGIPIGEIPSAALVEDLEGNPVNLGDYVGAGKPLLVEFWATWCSNCKALEPQMLAAHERFGEDVDLLVLAVAVNQSQRKVRRHAEKHEVPGRMLYDKNGEAVRAFKAPATSYIVVLDGAGKVVYTGLGEGQDIEAAVLKGLGRESAAN
jgi:thiol-disulfide isomerase/thioredoxin